MNVLALSIYLFVKLDDRRLNFFVATDYYAPDNKLHGVNMGSIWFLSVPDGPHVGPMNLPIWGVIIELSVGN